jgi:hypothetical protein
MSEATFKPGTRVVIPGTTLIPDPAKNLFTLEEVMIATVLTSVELEGVEVVHVQFNDLPPGTGQEWWRADLLVAVKHSDLP